MEKFNLSTNKQKERREVLHLKFKLFARENQSLTPVQNEKRLKQISSIFIQSSVYDSTNRYLNPENIIFTRTGKKPFRR